MKKKKLIAFLAVTLCLAAVPAYAVLSEKDLGQTLSVLRYELRSAWEDMELRRDRTRGRGARQHAQLVEMMQRSNELSLMLYSQKQDYTFDMTYALNEVSRQYEDFAAQKLPFDDIIQRLDIDIDRYDRLIHTLRSLPPTLAMEYVDSAGRVVQLPSRRRPDGVSGRPRTVRTDTTGRERPFQLDSIGQQDRDTCIAYAQKLLDASVQEKERLVRDSTHYAETAAMLKSAYDYAQDRYKTVQNKIFIEGQTGYLTILKSFSRYWSQAVSDSRDKYSALGDVHSQWRGPMVAGFALFILFYLILSAIISIALVYFLTRKVPFFQKEQFAGHRFEMSLLTGVILFAVSIMIASAASMNNFFSMASNLLEEFAWMLAAILVSLVIRLQGDQIRKGLGLYFPILLLSLIVISLRIAFIPNSMLNIIFPPLLLLFTIFQGWALGHYKKNLPQGDIIFGWITLLMLVVTTFIAFFGYVLMGVQILIWWIFQLTLLQTITAVSDLLHLYYVRHVKSLKTRYVKEHPHMPHKTDEDMILVTWPHSFIKQALLPVSVIISFPLSLYMASGVFDLNGVFKTFYRYPFLDVTGYIRLSFSNIILALSLFFLFRYLVYLGKALYRYIKISSILKNSSVRKFHENQVNFTLVENVIGITLWGIYIITIFILLKIPTSAIKLICAGLATGVGFAMKDILNNFFYGVQLMSGRLRVGDLIECDGVRGRVDNISYQTTQIIATDGSVMAFPNATLFNKNFKNFTKNHSYELLSFDVGVKYGSDVDEVRRIIVEALEPLRIKDSYGREVVNPDFGIQVRFKDFGDNSVNLSVLQQTTVDEHFTYAAKAKELIYKALNEHGIEIPFPQRDLYIKTVPEKD